MKRVTGVGEWDLFLKTAVAKMSRETGAHKHRNMMIWFAVK
jgi:hypothetical protein